MATEPIDLEAAGQCVSALGNAIGMPQLCDAWFANQVFWLAVALISIYLILVRVALPRMSAVLSERSGTMSNDIAAAEDLKKQAAEAEVAYEKELADARAQSLRISGEARATIKADLDAAIAKADVKIAKRAAESEAQIAEIRAGAMDSVSEVARDVAGAVVAALGGRVEQADIDAAVSDRMKGN